MRFPKPGTALGFLALFVALSGGAYAAITLPKNSVTTRQVKDRSLLARDFKRGQIPRGARGPVGPIGPQGIQGAQGPQGPPGPTQLATLQTANGPTSYVAPLDVGSSEANCPVGTKAVSGGGAVISGAGDGMAVSQASSDRHSWFVVAANNSSSTTETIQAIAYCATSGSAVAARTRGPSRDVAVQTNRLRAATPRSYKNCTAMNRVYPHGVGRRGARDHTSGTPVTNFRVSNRIYAYNDGKAPLHPRERDLDRDNDGIACEKR